MNYIDLHCDALTKTMINHGQDASLHATSDTMVDFQSMKKGNCLLQVLAIWVVPQEGYQKWFQMPPISEEAYVRGCLKLYQKNMRDHAKIIGTVHSVSEIFRNHKQGKMSTLLAVEDCGILHGDLENINRLYAEGVRMMGVLWNEKNCMGSPQSRNVERMQEGLTAFGREAVSYMQEKGMVVDVSHLSDGGFYEVAELAKRPFIASHSNCRACAPHTRNLTDEMIRILAEHGGVAGVNFGPEFLNRDIEKRESKVEQIVEMMWHMRKIGGSEVIAIGTDFDGIEGNLEIASPAEMPKLFEKLRKKGFTSAEVEKIAKENALRVLKDCLS